MEKEQLNQVELPTTAGKIGEWLGAEVLGNPNQEVGKFSPLEQATPDALTFISQPRYSDLLKKNPGCVVLASPDLAKVLLEKEHEATFILVANPQFVFSQLSQKYKAPFFKLEGIAKTAVIHPSVVLSEGVQVGDYAILEAGVKLGRRTRVHAHVHLGANVEIGEDSEIHPKVVIYPKVKIGNQVKIFSGTVIGSEGFGLVENPQTKVLDQIPHLGTVVIEDDVRIGSLCTIDRSTFAETRISKGVKLDNLVHVGHNCQIGERSVLCAQVGLAGSVHVEEEVLLGGQAGFGQGVRIGKRARVGGQSGSSSNIAGNETYFLTPSIPIRETAKVLRYFRKLPEIWKRIRKLEQHLNINSHGDAKDGD